MQHQILSKAGRTGRTARKNSPSIQQLFTTAKGRAAFIQQLFATPENRIALKEWVQHNIETRQRFEQKILEQRQALKTVNSTLKPQVQVKLQELRKQCSKTLTPMEAKALNAYIEQIEQSGRPNIATIAEECKIGTGMVNTHLSNAKEKLRKMILNKAIAKGLITLDNLEEA